MYVDDVDYNSSQFAHRFIMSVATTCIASLLRGNVIPQTTGSGKDRIEG